MEGKNVLQKSRHDLMVQEYKSILLNGLKQTAKGALYGTLFALIVSRNKGRAVQRYSALGMGFGAGYAVYQGQQRFHFLKNSAEQHSTFKQVVRKDSYFDEKKFIESEGRVLVLSGIPLDQFKVRNVVIDDQNNYVRTIELGDPSKQTIVLIHGYGGSSVKFWKIVKPLSEKYHLLMIDIIGMGGSSRPEFNFSDPALVDEFLVDWLEKWRVSVGDIKDFVLAGHSFGGYVSGLYTLKYPQNVKKLLMLSPLGVSRMPADFDLNKEIEKFPPEMRPPKFLIKLAPVIWSQMSSPYELMRKTGPYFSGKILDFYASKRFQSLNAEELLHYKEYMKHTLLRPASTDNALFLNFDHLLFAKRPLEDADKLGGLNKPMSFFFGDRDWMLRVGSEHVLEKNPYRNKYSHMYIVPDSDHHLYFDNPVGLAEALLKDLENIDEIKPNQV